MISCFDSNGTFEVSVTVDELMSKAMLVCPCLSIFVLYENMDERSGVGERWFMVVV